MVVWIKNSIKKKNEEKEKEQLIRDEISELQDAMIEIAGLISDTYNNTAEEEMSNGNG